MATRTYIGDFNNDNFSASGNWSGGVVPTTNDDIVVTGNTTAYQFFGNLPSTAITLSGWSVTNNSSTTVNYFGNISNSISVGFANGLLDYAYTLTFTSGSTIKIDFPNLTALSQYTGAFWKCFTHGTGTFYKTGSGFLQLRGPTATANLAAGWEVSGGGLVAEAANSLGGGYVALRGNSTFLASANAGAITLANSAFYLIGNNLRLGSWYSGHSSGAITLSNVIFRRGSGPELKVINVSGANVTISKLSHDGAENNCGVRLEGTATITFSGNPSGSGSEQYIVGPVTAISPVNVSMGASATNVFRGATILDSSRFTWNATTTNLGNIGNYGSETAVAFYFPRGGKTIVTGYANADVTMPGLLADSGVSGDAYVTKEGTGAWTIDATAQDNTTTAFMTVNTGRVVAKGRTTALGVNSSWVAVYQSAQLELQTGLAKSNAALYVGATSTTQGAVHVASGDRTYNCSTVFLRNNPAPFSADSGATLRITCAAGGNVGQDAGTAGIRKLGAGTVRFTVSSGGAFTYTGSTLIEAGKLSLSGGSLGTRTIALSGGTLLDTVLASGVTLSLAGSSGIESNVASAASFTDTTTVPAGQTLTLTPTATEPDDKPVRILNKSPIVVPSTSTLRIGAALSGRMRYGASLTFNNGATLKLG